MNFLYFLLGNQIFIANAYLIAHQLNSSNFCNWNAVPIFHLFPWFLSHFFVRSLFNGKKLDDHQLQGLAGPSVNGLSFL